MSRLAQASHFSQSTQNTHFRESPPWRKTLRPRSRPIVARIARSRIAAVPSAGSRARRWLWNGGECSGGRRCSAGGRSTRPPASGTIRPTRSSLWPPWTPTSGPAAACSPPAARSWKCSAAWVMCGCPFKSRPPPSAAKRPSQRAKRPCCRSIRSCPVSRGRITFAVPRFAGRPAQLFVVRPAAFRTGCGGVNRTSHLSAGGIVWLATGLLAVVLAGGCRAVSSGRNIDGVRYFQQGQYPVALQRFDSALTIDSRNPDSYYNKAAVFHRMGTQSRDQNALTQAESLYKQALDLNPNHVDAHRGLAVLLTETGRVDQAFNLMKTWAVTSPQNAEARVELARLYEEYGDPKSAELYLNEALTLSAGNWRAHAALGRLREQAGDYAQAPAELSKGPDAQPLPAADRAADCRPANARRPHCRRHRRAHHRRPVWRPAKRRRTKALLAVLGRACSSRRNNGDNGATRVLSTWYQVLSRGANQLRDTPVYHAAHVPPPPYRNLCPRPKLKRFPAALLACRAGPIWRGISMSSATLTEPHL